MSQIELVAWLVLVLGLCGATGALGAVSLWLHLKTIGSERLRTGVAKAVGVLGPLCLTAFTCLLLRLLVMFMQFGAKRGLDAFWVNGILFVALAAGAVFGLRRAWQRLREE